MHGAQLTALRSSKSPTGGTGIETFDYIIVGSGTAGATLAARLSEDEACRVLVLEAGGTDRRFWLRLPVGYFKSIYNEKVSHLFKGDPDAGIAGRAMDVPRGRVLGGSSSINGLIYIRGQREDFDDWERLGATGWRYADVLPHFRNIESYDGPPSQFRGSYGPLHVSDLRNDNAMCDAWLAAARYAGLPDNPDFNGPGSSGIGAYQLTLKGRWRDSAATAYLRPALARANLTLKTHARVVGLVFAHDSVTGVRYVRQGRTVTSRASREVILCAGAVQSPQILQLAGIGPAGLLEAHGIPVRVDAAEVGANLQDHLQMRTIVELKDPTHSLNTQIRNPFKALGFGLDWLINARGPLTVGAGQVGGAACTRLARNGRPDIQLFVMPLSVDKPGLPLHRYPGFTVSYWQCHPESRGRVTLMSADPLDDPRIETNYLSTDQDCQTMVEGLKVTRDIYNAPPFRPHWNREVIPGPGTETDDQILEAIRQRGSTLFHAVGTCRMGSDDASVVDPELRVRGVTGLRVVDASVMPRITSANTSAATFMIAEKAAAVIRES
ncbi:MAG: choline dehydrogenase [Boseongicola sp. SB0667_bin_21]|nr:choline dehydrogenase [Boseongicola sp. SB0667_bin_21]